MNKALTYPPIDLVIPLYNPATNWEHTLLSRLQEFEKLKKESFGLILINDGSSETISNKSILLIKSHYPQLQFINYKTNKGKGYAVRQGVKKSKASYTIITDIDIPYTANSMEAIVQKLQSGLDIAAGNRLANYYESVPLFRKILSQGLRSLLTSSLGLSINDSQCGLKGFNKKGKNLFLTTQINEFLFDLEFLMLAEKSPNHQVEGVPVQLRSDIQFTKMRPSVLLRELRNLLQIYWRFLFE